MGAVDSSTSALLRVASLPTGSWLGTADPAVFVLVRLLDDAETAWRDGAATVAVRIGTDLVPLAALTDRDRALALDVRRRLHRAAPVDPAALTGLGDLAVAAGVPGLAADLAGLAVDLTRLVALRTRAEAAVTVEENRLLGLPWRLAGDHPELARAMRQADAALFDDIAARVARGDDWHTKRMRRRSDHLWRLVDRATVKPTPRGWFAHVALVRSGPGGSGRDLAVTAATATTWTENLHRRRHALLAAGLVDAPATTPLTVAPLHWTDGDRLVAWATTVGTSIEITEVRVRRTAPVEAVTAVLRHGARTLGEIEETLAPGADERSRPVLRGFLDHLARVGIVEICGPPLSHTRRSTHPSDAAEGSRAGRGGDLGYLDVYRESAAPLPAGFGADLTGATRRLAALLRLIDEDAAPARAAAHPDIVAEPRPVLDLLRDRLDRPPAPHRHRSGAGWPRPVTPGSGYDRLVRWLDTTAGADPVDLTADVLDRFGATDVDLAWPVDLLVRPLPDGPAAALDSAYHAGVLDARFVASLESLHGPVPHVEWYRHFLDEVERLTGHLLVEVLVPPLSDRAANAVRRPRYTRAWTGDADLHSYCGPGAAARYIPLDAIVLRRDGGRIVATVDGRPIWPVYHATRSAIPPWNHVLTLLRAAAPTPHPYLAAANLQRPLTVLPTRAHLPAITLDGRLLLSSAQWHVDRAELWTDGAGTLEKARTLDALRRRRELPRWVFVTGPGGTGVPCDLAGLRGVRAVDRVLSTGADRLLIIEAAPAPGGSPVVDRGRGGDARLSAELMVRVPAGVPPSELARRAAAALRPAARPLPPPAAIDHPPLTAGEPRGEEVNV